MYDHSIFEKARGSLRGALGKSRKLPNSGQNSVSKRLKNKGCKEMPATVRKVSSSAPVGALVEACRPKSSLIQQKANRSYEKERTLDMTSTSSSDMTVVESLIDSSTSMAKESTLKRKQENAKRESPLQGSTNEAR